MPAITAVPNLDTPGLRSWAKPRLPHARQLTICAHYTPSVMRGKAPGVPFIPRLAQLLALCLNLEELILHCPFR